MKQTTASVVFEVQPKSATLLGEAIAALRPAATDSLRAEAQDERFRIGVPLLHFMSMSVFEDEHFDPILVIEVNFDGPPGPFWAQLEATIGADLRKMLTYCERPAGRASPMFDAIVAPGSRHPIAPLLEMQTVRPVVRHAGNRGLSRTRVVREGQLFASLQEELAEADDNDPARYRALGADGIHAALRAKLRMAFPWLDEPVAPRIGWLETVGDIARLAAFVFVLLFVLSFPGIVLGLAIGPWISVPIVLLAAVAVAWFVENLADLANILKFLRKLALFIAIALAVVLAIYVLVATLLTTLVIAPVTGVPLRVVATGALQIYIAAVASIPLSLAAILFWLRQIEITDPSHGSPPVNESRMKAMLQREDLSAQNHMGSLVLVKPGLLRAGLIRAGMIGFGLVLRIAARSGYLGSMRTIHFAHWALVSNGGRLIFFSNFDGTWESYLDDFIEKAHPGLTFAWCNGVGFPPTRFAVLDGATQGRLFKTWARHSMAVSLFWYSAYPDFTVEHIERHARVADGLRRATLPQKEALAWTTDL